MPSSYVTSNLCTAQSSTPSKEQSKSITSPNRKKPIPEPRSALSTPMVTTPETRNNQTLQENPIKNENTGLSKSHHLSSSSITRTLRNYLPEVPKTGTNVQPVPTSEFQSFRRCPKSTSAHSSLIKTDLNCLTSGTEASMVCSTRQKLHEQPTIQTHKDSVNSQLGSTPTNRKSSSSKIKRDVQQNIIASKATCASALPEYVNTTPPAVPARNPPLVTSNQSSNTTTSPEEHIAFKNSITANFTPRKLPHSEMLQQSQKPSSRRFSGEYASIPPSELLDGLSLNAPIPQIGRRSSAETSTNNVQRDHALAGRRSSNPLPPPPVYVTPEDSANPTSFPYYVSDVYKENYEKKSSVPECFESGIPTSASCNQKIFSDTVRGSPPNVTSMSTIASRDPKMTNTSKAIQNITPLPPHVPLNNPDLPPSFTPGTYTVHDINQGKSKGHKKAF